MTYDYQLLKRLYELHSPSRNEKNMRKLLQKLCEERGATVEKDKNGNLLVTKGKAKTYPCICAHMDQVQHQHSKDFTVMKVGDIIMAYSPKSMAQQGLGADDKNGIWIALELLRTCRVLKCAFFVGEEIGCVGSNAVDLAWFKDVRYCVQPDRRNGGDLITSISGRICSEEFEQAIDAKMFGYLPTEGLSTDVGTLAHRGVGVSCINISCGYYHPHSDHECTKWSELCNALDFARSIVKLKGVYQHKYEVPKLEPCSCRSYFSDDWGWLRRDFGYSMGKRRAADALPMIKAKDPLAHYAHENAKRDRLRDNIVSILEMEPHLNFEEMQSSYPSVFEGQDVDIARTIYKDEKERVERMYNGL